MKKNATEYFFIIVFISFLVLSFLIIQPFITSIISGIIVALVVYPLFVVVKRRLKRKRLSAALVTIFVLFIMVTPAVFLFQQIGYQAKVAYVLTKQKVLSGDLLGDEVCNGNSDILCRVNDYVKKVSVDPEFVYQRNQAIGFIEDFLWRTTPSLISAIPKLIFNFILMTFVLYYSLVNGKAVFLRFKDLLPLKSSHKNKIIKKLKDVNYAIIYGHVITGLVQGVVGLIGMYIFNVTNPLLLGFAMICAALIPFIGAPLVWLPISLLKISEGVTTNNQSELFNGIGLFLYGLLIIGTIDNIIKPKIMGDKAQVNPVIILLGILGGVSLFGIIGVIVGPLLLALTTTLIDIYEAERSETKS